jgi:hypothetical protein
MWISSTSSCFTIVSLVFTLHIAFKRSLALFQPTLLIIVLKQQAKINHQRLSILQTPFPHPHSKQRAYSFPAAAAAAAAALENAAAME